MAKFNKGDQVEFVTDGPRMVVLGPAVDLGDAPGEGMVVCAWFNSAHDYREQTLREELLKLVGEKTASTPKA